MNNFRTLDLNLLRVFDAVMSEGSLTRAADVLALTQPAASHALKRLHRWVGEPLFQRHGKGLTPTPRALVLWPQVRAALGSLELALAPSVFDPRHDRAELRLLLADAVADRLAPPLVSRVQGQAPLVDLRFVPLTSRDPRPELQEGRVDLAVGHFPALLGEMATEGPRSPYRHRLLHRTDYVGVMRAGHPLADGALTLERYIGAQHVLVSVGGGAHAEVDEALAMAGRRRRVLLTVNQYRTAVHVVQHSDLLVVLPESFVAPLAESAGAGGPTLVTQALPMSIPPLTVSMVWLARRDAEPALRWLRDAVALTAAF